MTISVTQLNNYIHGIFDTDGILNNVSVCGEITNAKRSRDGWYFSLKDDNAAIDCFCYPQGMEPAVGMQIVAEGRINFWAKSGRVSFFIRRFTASQNTGAAYLKFLELKEKLQKEGLFEEIRKKSIPQYCLKIGVVTSATGAVIHDIENVVHRRQPFSDIILYPVKVQGVGADEEIVKGIEYFSRSDVDVVIVGRGGGSNEDLSAFNSEIVVRAVAACQKPVVSAVGHGVDFTLCDFAADRRAVTPTEAAEFVTIDSAALKLAITTLLQHCFATLNRRLAEHKNRTVYSVQRLSSRVAFNIQAQKAAVKMRLNDCTAKIKEDIAAKNTRVQTLTVRLSAANPANILQRGYSYLDVDGKRVSSVKQISEGDKLNVTLCDGKAETSVLKVIK